MRSSWLRNGSVVFFVLAASFGAGTKTDVGHLRNLDVSIEGEDSDGLSLLTQLRQVLSTMASSSLTDHAATPESLSKMEVMATSLAKMSKAQASPFDGIIKTMSETISQILDVRIIQDLGVLNEKMRAFKDLFMVCDQALNNATQPAMAIQKQIPQMASDHTACRTDEATRLEDMKACKASLQTSRMVFTTGCDIVVHYGYDDATSLCAPKLAETAEEYNRRMVSEFKSRLDTIRSQKHLCDNASSAVNSQQHACAQEETGWQNKRESCNVAQDALDNKACEFALEMNSTCVTYQSCRSQTMYSYNLANKTTQQALAGLRTEYSTMKRVACLLDHLGGDRQKLQQCMQNNYDVSHLKVNASEPPECLPCESLAEQPGTAEYNQTVFAGLPEDAPPIPCTASCCVTI